MKSTFIVAALIKPLSGDYVVKDSNIKEARHVKTATDLSHALNDFRGEHILLFECHETAKVTNPRMTLDGLGRHGVIELAP